MGKSESFEFKNMDDTESSVKTGSEHRREGCFVSTVSGFVLFLLAAVLAVGVGIIVHFAGNRQQVECKCSYPGIKDSTLSPSALLSECRKLASDGNVEVCSSCPKTTVTHTVGTSTTVPPTVRNVLLPGTLFPELYTLELQPYIYDREPENFIFEGHVKIRMHCRHSTGHITLHVNNLNITRNATILEEGGNSVGYSSIETDLKNQFIIFHLNEDLKANKYYTIEMAFIGPIKNDLVGLYYSSYVRENRTRYVLGTQLEPTDARKIFPCFDEPALKAKFDITFVRKSDMVALTNTPKISSENRGNGWIADTYNTTVTMPTYLLAFILSDYSYTETKTKTGVTIRAWARPDAVNQTYYGTHICANVTEQLEDYLKVPYPMQKQDNFPIPDMLAWAMENWGLITYRDKTLLYDSKASSAVNKQRVAEVVAHELGHMWFGNLVSPAWWDQIWLNEGFATMFQYIGVDLVNPDWHMMEQFIEDLHEVFSFDGLMTSRPMIVQVSYPIEVFELFDPISYKKGASMLRMMKFFLGDDIWLRGLTRYLNQLKFGVATQDDLWFALGNQSKEDAGPIHNVKSIMDTWTLQMNYPVVMVTRENSNKIRMEQKRFLRSAGQPDPKHFESKYGYRWEIPFTFTTSSSPEFDQSNTDISWLSVRDMSHEIQLNTNQATSSWVIGNVMMHGYYRVNYDENNWNGIIHQLNTDHTVIHVINRAQIINDAFNLATSGDLKMEIALRTLEYLNKETEYLPWKTALNELTYLSNMLERTGSYGKFGAFMKSKLEGIYNSTGLDNRGASHIQSLTRTMISKAACSVGVRTCVNKALDLFNQWMASPVSNPIDPSVRSAVYCTAIRHGSHMEWEFVHKQYIEAMVDHEKQRLLHALACSREIWRLSSLMKMAISTDDVRKHDAYPVLAALTNNDITSTAVWYFVRAEWSTISTTYGFALADMVPRITKKLNNQYQLEQLEEFIEENFKTGTNSRVFRQAVEKTKININWMKTNYNIVENWLQNY